jgi:hypothetical protein
MRNWRASGVAAALGVSIFLVVQLALPILRFGDGDRAQRFGWQMFSTAERAPEFVVETQVGNIDIVLEDYMARVRSDVDIEGQMPPHLCVVVDDAIRVTWDGGSLQC